MSRFIQLSTNDTEGAIIDRDEVEYVIDNGVTRAIHFRSGRTLFNVQATIQQLVGSLNGNSPSAKPTTEDQ